MQAQFTRTFFSHTLNEYNPFLTKTTELRLPLFVYVDFIMKLTIILFGNGN